MSLLLLASALAAAPALTADGLAPALAPMAGMVGRWVGRNDEELWGPAGDALFGLALTRGGAATSFEFCKVEAHEGGLRYVAAHRGLGPVPFTWTPGTAWTWDNPSHDFPQRIRYARTGDRMRA